MRTRLSRLLGTGPAREAAPAAAGELERVHPQLADLSALSRRAASLPGWQDRAHARRSGVYHAAMKGRGMEYAESRPYQPGDDVRALDWRLTARSGKPHTKLFREERERPVYVLVDLRRTMAFATRGAFKSVQAARTAALVAWKTVQGGDRIGAVLLGDAGCDELAPARGTVGALRVLKHLVQRAQPVATPAPLPLAAAVERLRRLVKPGSIVFVLSDFRDLDEAARAALGQVGRHNETLLVQCYDAFEAALPAIREPVALSDRARRIELTLGDRAVAEAYAQRFASRRAALQQFARDQRLRLVTLTTTDDPYVILQRALS